MKRYLLFVIIWASYLHGFSQDRPVIFPEDVSSSEYSLRCFCSPGVWNKSRNRGIEIAYDLLLENSTVKEEDEPILPPPSEVGHLEQYIFKIKIPVLLKEHVKILLGYDYSPEQYHFKSIGPSFNEVFTRLDNRLMKSNAFSLYLTRPVNERHYLAFRLRALYNGDYRGWVSLDNDYAVYSAIAIWGFKKHDDLEWGAGLTFSTGFRQTVLLPFLMYNRNFTQNFGVESVLPAYIFLRYNFSKKSLLLLGPQYSSRSYAVHLDDSYSAPPVYQLNHSEIRYTLSLEQKIVPWLWFNLQTGYQMNFSTDFDVGSQQLPPFRVELENGFFLRAGIFLSPPDSLY